MKRLLILILICISTEFIQGQPVINFNKFPVTGNDTVPMKTADLLKALDWESIMKLSDTTKEYHTSIYDGKLLTKYEHSRQGYSNLFRIGSYKGLVLYFESNVSKSSKSCDINYFDKSVWLMLANDCLPNLPDSMKLTTTESKEILEAYYNLLGVNAADEYGWICEYSTVGMEPTKRQAVAQLIYNGRLDLLRKLIKYPNPQTQVYAADAMIFLDYFNKPTVEEFKLEIVKYQKELDSLNILKEKDSTINTYHAQYRIKDYTFGLNYLLITDNDWKTIYELRDSNQPVMICGNFGSYKLYKSSTKELLSDKAISEIPEKYIEIDDSTLRLMILSRLKK